MQGWIGNSAIVIERELFGQDLHDEYHGEGTAKKIEEQIRRLADTILPLQDRANRMMVRNLSELRASTSRRWMEPQQRSDQALNECRGCYGDNPVGQIRGKTLSE